MTSSLVHDNLSTNKNPKKKGVMVQRSRKIPHARILGGKDKLKEKMMVIKLQQLKEERKEVSEQQSCIREGQRQVKEKFEAIESECENLRAETMKIMQQSSRTRLRLALMFLILKARQNNDYAKASELTNALRLVSL